jgi:hypothetical protein
MNCWLFFMALVGRILIINYCLLDPHEPLYIRRKRDSYSMDNPCNAQPSQLEWDLNEYNEINAFKNVRSGVSPVHNVIKSTWVFYS